MHDRRALDELDNGRLATRVGNGDVQRQAVRVILAERAVLTTCTSSRWAITSFTVA
jgi:hypothetical protein